MIDLEFTEMIFRLWGCCVVTSICVSAATVLGVALTVGNVKEKKKAHLGTGEPGDVKNTSSNLHN